MRGSWTLRRRGVRARIPERHGDSLLFTHMAQAPVCQPWDSLLLPRAPTFSLTHIKTWNLGAATYTWTRTWIRISSLSGPPGALECQEGGQELFH